MDTPAEKGHNSIAKDQLISIIQRVENLAEEKAAIAEDIKEVYAEAKGNGLDVRAIKAIVKLRKLDAATREEQETILDIYMNAIGMIVVS